MGESNKNVTCSVRNLHWNQEKTATIHIEGFVPGCLTSGFWLLQDFPEPNNIQRNIEILRVGLTPQDNTRRGPGTILETVAVGRDWVGNPCPRRQKVPRDSRQKGFCEAHLLTSKQ
ncbi:hypothetical protein Y1Q_0023107 [Alligator mississippiensis]|uniref:Uncharacterized protein n=1 Tax=Alligator mississippiensis TaxID=8496 RepID=A0A151P632_ALLMI|nr:hypothetical protein Y1Q_0023107 [Alligator mississippiensis]